MPSRMDAVVIGSGPNGLAAAILLARAGRSVIVLEAKATPGGGVRSAELTLPGFTHDVCSSVFPLGISSPFFRSLGLEQHGLKWIQPAVPLAHPFDDGSAALLLRDLRSTARGLGVDGACYSKLFGPLAEHWDILIPELLSPVHVPRHPLMLARFGWWGIQPATRIAYGQFRTAAARALFGGLAAHAMLPLDYPLSGAFALILGSLGHAVGWPIAAGGSQRIADALVSVLRSAGGSIETQHPVRAWEDLPAAKDVLFDTAPRQLLGIARDRLPASYRRRLERYRYGPGIYKMDWALSRPIPWKAPACVDAGTLHLGGTMEEIAESEEKVARGEVPERPFVLLVQASRFDSARAPVGQHTAWGYCHVPNGCPEDMTGRIEAQVERFAPGFRDLILARHAIGPRQLEDYNGNYVGGDIAGGANDLTQFLTRPVARLVPYTTPVRGIYLCSSSTPPGSGVHGMCGYHAAQAVLRA